MPSAALRSPSPPSSAPSRRAPHPRGHAGRPGRRHASPASRAPRPPGQSAGGRAGTGGVPGAAAAVPSSGIGSRSDPVSRKREAPSAPARSTSRRSRPGCRPVPRTSTLAPSVAVLRRAAHGPSAAAADPGRRSSHGCPVRVRNRIAVTRACLARLDLLRGGAGGDGRRPPATSRTLGRCPRRRAPRRPWRGSRPSCSSARSHPACSAAMRAPSAVPGIARFAGASPVADMAQSCVLRAPSPGPPNPRLFQEHGLAGRRAGSPRRAPP